jgi:predicted metalloendopeptidase
MRLLRVVLCLAVIGFALPLFSGDNKDVDPKTGLRHGFDPNAMDKTADPCNDFFQYACGGWIAKNPIPAEYPDWDRFSELYEVNLAILHNILDKAAVADHKRSPEEQKIGDYYASCMEEAAVEQKGASVLKPQLDHIAAMKSKNEMAEQVAHLQNYGIPSLLRFNSQQDFKNAESMIAEFDQGGLGLPDRDYYVKDEADKKEKREKYQLHVQKMFQLLGDSPTAAADEAKVVMAIETDLAKASQDRTFRRDPNNVYHKMSKAEFLKLSPNFNWQQYWTLMKVPQFSEVNVAPPDFLKGVNVAVDAHPVEHWKTYLRWKVLNSAAPYLSKAFVDEDFDFNEHIMGGSEQIRPRWKRCVDYVDGNLGEALGKVYVDQTFGAEGKRRMLEMVDALHSALAKDIAGLDWMDAATKEKAGEKLKAFARLIGYPDKWRDYSTLTVVRDDFYGNVNRGDGFEKHRLLNRVGKPVDHGEWLMSPPTVNAYYRGSMNDITFPAGILQPPFFENSMDDAVNFGGIGLVIGHEMTHGFDDQGRKFDAHGNLNDWWSAEDGKKFEERASCFVNEYAGFSPVDDMHLNGKLTLGENTADNGGARIAYMALMQTLGEKARSDPKALEKIDGFTPEQRYFLGFGQVWCDNRRPEFSKQMVTLDPHSPDKFRVNGVVQNMPEFQKAFSCKAGSPMVRQQACRVW